MLDGYNKKILKIALAIICWIGAIKLLFEIINSLRYLDSWGLGFTFYTLPIGVIGILLLLEAINLTKEFITNKK